jgi:DNA-binding protein HU-beta
MNKRDLINEVAKTSGISRKDAKSAINAVFLSIESVLKKGGEATLPGFGTFTALEKLSDRNFEKRQGRRIKVKFKAGRAFSDSIISSSYDDFEEEDSSQALSYEDKSVNIHLNTNDIESINNEESITPAILVRVDETIKYVNETYDKTDQLIDYSLNEIGDLRKWFKALKI